MGDHAALLARVPSELWIGNRQVSASTGRTFAVRNPADGEVLADIADASVQDGLRALDAACAAQSDWAATSPRVRSDILLTAWNLLNERRDEFAAVITLEMGKPLSESHGEVTYGGDFLRWFSEESVRIGGRCSQSPSGAGRIWVTKEPVGPTLAITPWNFPLAMGTRKIAPAIAAGCTMVVKPAEESPLTMLLLAEVLRDAGLPDGVLSVLPTSDAAALTAPILADPRLRKLTFTGSTAVGKTLMRQAAGHVLRTSMELGGNAPFVVFEDADVDAAVDGAMVAKMRNGGQACTAANRIYVDERVLAQFTARLTAKMRSLKMGPGHLDDVQVGPIISEKQRSRVASLVDDAAGDGAEIVTGGRRGEGVGYFYEPTILIGVPSAARILREEIFGPVAVIVGFHDEAEGFAAANDTRSGLAAYVYTANLARALRAADAIQAGMIAINRGALSDVAAPFGGTKESGLGREGGIEGIEEYLEAKYVAMP